jgi:hypothetical protein
MGYVKNEYGQIITTSGRDGDKQTIGTGGEGYNMYPLQSRVYESSGSSIWRR